MSGWTVMTLRARASRDYDDAEYDDSDSWSATADIVATADEDDRVYDWTTWSSHVYVYLNCPRYDFDTAESVLDDYQDMVKDAVVLGANDTSDTGEARYYDVMDTFGGGPLNSTDRYRETQSEDGAYVGEIALSVMNARHSIVSRDPFHNECGWLDDRYLEDGVNRGDQYE